MTTNTAADQVAVSARYRIALAGEESLTHYWSNSYPDVTAIEALPQRYVLVVVFTEQEEVPHGA